MTYNYPNVRYSDGSGDGLQAYSFSGSTQHQLYDGEVIRFVVDDGDFSSYSYSSPVKDELINAVGDYYETLATDPKTAKKAESAYQAALENFFDENMQTELTTTPTVTSTPLPVQSATEQNTLKVENGKLTGTLMVKLNSNLTEEKKVSVMAAVYDSNGKLIGIKPKEISLKPGNENQVEFKEISADSADEYTIKILTWNGNISSLAPISNTLDLSIK